MEDTQSARLAFFEMLLYWQGECRTTQLVQQFGVTRAQIGKDVKYYRHQYPNALAKGASPFKPTLEFKSQFYSGSQHVYLQWVESGIFESKPIASPDWFSETKLHSSEISPAILWPIIRALQQKQRIEVDYVSLNSPDRSGRIIQPHSLVKTGQRYHLRAYCEKAQEFRDFVLTRFLSVPTPEGGATKFINDDLAFNTSVTLEIIPDQRLDDAQQQVIARDFQMTDKRLLIHTKAALAHYVLMDLGISDSVIHVEPKAQQVILSNRAELKPWLLNN